MLHRGKPKDSSSSRKVTPPSPTYMNNEQFAAYLAGLRENRVNRPGTLSRPGGARPLPPSTRSRPGTTEQLTTAGRSSIAGDSIRSELSNNHQRAGPDAARPRGSRPSVAGSVTSRYSVATASGKDYFPDKPAAAPLRPSEVVPSATYIERGQRWMEKEEAFSLHQAMDAIDIKDEQEDEQEQDDEKRLYNAALNEAAELVYRHEHGIKPREPDAPYRYKPHMRKNSYAHARTASVGRYGGDIGATGLARDSVRSFSGSSSGSDRDSSPGSDRGSMDQQRNIRMGSANQKPRVSTGRGARVSSGSSHRRSSIRRNISGEIEKPFSGDQIWEEPEGVTAERISKRQPQLPDHSQPLGVKTRNPSNKVQFAPGSSHDPDSSTISTPIKPLSRTEIHKNPPSQSRNPNYTRNEPSESPHPSQDMPRKNGVEIRSDDIRQATSMRLKDRSPKLPTPSAVSDSPGRPIVSFDKNWKAPEEAAADPKPDESRRIPFGIAKERPGPQGPQPPIPTILCTPDIPTTPSSNARSPRHPTPIPSIHVDSDDGPSVPVIAISDDHGPQVPTIVLPDGDDSCSDPASSIPFIVTPDDTPSKPSARPLPEPKSTSHSRSPASSGRPRGHWSPAPGASRRATATCHECSNPIEGRFVALSGGSERFHPQCFRCYTCGTSLEALEISPEPDHFYSERLDRIRRRAAGEILEETPGQTMAEDGDERLRFFCHLDWHELFAPQCKHCKTPILGEHIIALGEHWHYGHFFCAECGDPFEQGMTHIEKDGYAWCVACQTKRTERRAPKCKRCKMAVIGQYVKALGAEWHDECFRCATCGGGFDDGQVFPVGEGDQARVLCTGCRAQELKM
ncbi:hypothetical protein F5Y09DRAFT_325163 [Xylaria sp. FL1042]|nr:hypothetical protein F5Y09DRAFT_325163 [Xylaria sp. FL1042]